VEALDRINFQWISGREPKETCENGVLNWKSTKTPLTVSSFWGGVRFTSRSLLGQPMPKAQPSKCLKIRVRTLSSPSFASKSLLTFVLCLFLTTHMDNWMVNNWMNIINQLMNNQQKMLTTNVSNQTILRNRLSSSVPCLLPSPYWNLQTISPSLHRHFPSRLQCLLAMLPCQPQCLLAMSPIRPQCLLTISPSQIQCLPAMSPSLPHKLMLYKAIICCFHRR
jgi:hypothetical protein